MEKLKLEQKKMTNFIGKRLTGSKITIKKHQERALKVATAIYERFGVHAYQYKQKHLVWIINVYIEGYAKSTRYNYYLTILKLLSLSSKYIKWELSLKKQYKAIEKKRMTDELLRSVIF